MPAWLTRSVQLEGKYRLVLDSETQEIITLGEFEARTKSRCPNTISGSSFSSSGLRASRPVVRADLNDLREFAESFKLHTPVPADLISIVTQDPAKREELREKVVAQIFSGGTVGGAVEKRVLDSEADSDNEGVKRRRL